MGAVYPAALSFLGIAKEVTPGTAVAPTRFIPYSGFVPKEKPPLLIDEGVRGSMAVSYGGVMGPRSTEIELSGVPFSDSFGDLLNNMLGGYLVAGAGPYTHTFSVLNSGTGQPPTHTFSDRQGLTASTGAREWAGVCMEELKLSGNAEGLLAYEAKLKGWGSDAAALAPTNTPTTTKVTPAWRSSVTLGGTASPAVAEWEVTLSRELTVMHGTDGDQTPYAIARAGLGVAGKLTIWATDQAPLAAEGPLTTFLAGTEQALVIAVASSFGGTSGHSLTLTMTKAQFSTADLTRENLLGWEIEFTGHANSTDAGASGGYAPIKAVLVNGTTTYA
ncbi:phage tail tube protein [Streptomyces sp.]|uniref:phage tail tube protein n=1 Tax=Streptomyces sp. TaxID=1931 RepID=UPI002F945650